MKITRFGILFLLLFAAKAQGQALKGKLLDLVDNKPLAGATLQLTSVKDSTNRFNSVSDSAGVFQFTNLPVDSFFLSVSFISYESFKQIVSTNDSTPVVNVGTLFIPKKSVELSDVVIVSKAPPTQQKGDTLQYNASQYKVNPDATTEDLIKKMPGITVDKDGTVTAQGDQVKKVTIDGKDFFGDDASAALKNLPSSIIDKIQVFDKLSDQAQFTGFDDGNSVKSINIVTKTGVKNGQFGRVYAGVGTDDRYSAGGNMSFFNGDRRISLIANFNNINQQNFGSQDLLGVTSSGGNRGGGNFGGGRGGGGNRGGGGGSYGNSGANFSVAQQSGISKTNAAGINYLDKWGKKIDVQGSYFFNNSNNTNNELLKTQTLFGDLTQLSDEKSLSTSSNYNHRVNLRIEYRIDSSNSLIITPSLNFQNNKSVSTSSQQTYYAAGDTLNTSDNDQRANRNGYNLRNNILFRHAFAKKGRTISLNLNTTYNENNGETYVLSHSRFFDSLGVLSSDSLQDQYTNNPTRGYVLSGSVAYTEPLGQKGQLQFNYSPSYTKNKADQETFLFDEGEQKYSQFDTTLSNKFVNTVTTQSAGVSYRLGTTRDNQFSVGVNYQYSSLESERVFPEVAKVEQSFNTVLPNLMWRRKVSPRSSFNIMYRASTVFPSVTQLQDVVNNSNLLRLSVGNPDLKQSYTHFLSGRYTFINTQKGQSFFANVFLQAAQNYITTATYSPLTDSLIQHDDTLKAGAQLSKPINLNGYKSLRTLLTFSQPINFIKSNINLNAGFSYSALPGLANNVRSITNNYVYTGGVVLASNISEYIDFNLSYTANFNVAKNTAQPTLNTNYVNQSAGIQVNALSKSGWFIQNDITNESNSGLASGLNQNFWLWNAAIGKKFLKNQSGELKLSVFDLLKENQSIVRTVTANYIQDEQNDVLQQYFMLTFTYSLKNFGVAKAAAPARRSRMNF